jgi:hypothetical protein
MVAQSIDRQFHESFFRTLEPRSKRSPVSLTPVRKRLNPDESFVEAMIDKQFTSFNRGPHRSTHVKAELPNGELEIVEGNETFYVSTTQDIFRL